MLKPKILIWGVISFCFVFFASVFCFCTLFPLKYKDLVTEYAKQNNLNIGLVFAVIKVESHFNNFAVSSAGAKGLMQLLPETASWLDESDNPDLFDERTNIRLGSQYLSYLFTKFEDKVCVLASYNAGPTNVENWLKNKDYSKDGKTLFKIPFKETDNYVKKVLKNENIYEFLLK